jgi:hypothetical protein
MRSVRRTVIVRGTLDRRVSAAVAADLYEQTEQSIADGERQAELRRLAGASKPGRASDKA